MNKVKVKITTTQVIDAAGNEDIIELVTEATKEQLSDYIVIDYDESDITENSATKTRLKIYSDKMIMTKVGNVSSRMEFQESKSYQNVYSTPYGAFDLDFNTISFTNNLDHEGKGTVYVVYKIIIGGIEESCNKLKLDIF